MVTIRLVMVTSSRCNARSFSQAENQAIWKGSGGWV